MARSSTTATKFLILSDTHDFQFTDTAGTSLPFQLPTPPIDVLLHCGDLTQIGGVSSFKKALKMLASIPAELKLVIAGNHDLELDPQYWEAQRDEDGTPEDPTDHNLAITTMTGLLADEAGVIFLTEGTYTFTLQSGASFTIYVSPYTPAFGDWAFAYLHHEDRFNAPCHVTPGATSIATHPIPDAVDIFMTHGPPKGILDSCPDGGGNVGCGNLLQAIRRVRPKMHCFGHIHEGNGGRVVDWRNHALLERSLVGGEEEEESEAGHGRLFEEEEEEDEDAIVPNPYPHPLLWKNDDDDDSSGGGNRRTLFVNAAIMDRDNRPENAPWVVSLELLTRPCYSS